MGLSDGDTVGKEEGNVVGLADGVALGTSVLASGQSPKVYDPSLDRIIWPSMRICVPKVLCISIVY